MGREAPVKFDEIGYWSEIKLDIIKAYAEEYSKILSTQKRLCHVYIDAFAGAGVHVSKKTGEFIHGSPLNALYLQHPFDKYYFIDLDKSKVKMLKDAIGDRAGVQILEGDCNKVLLEQVFSNVKYRDFRRGLCLLDPYGLHLDWKVIETAGKMKSIEIFLNFPVMDMNMNALWHNPDKVDPLGIERMNSFWGDESWKKIAYTTELTLFGPEDKRADIEVVANGFRERLKNVAGFKYVPPPLPLRNTKGSIVYYLFFASPNSIGSKIVTHIFDKYRARGIR